MTFKVKDGIVIAGSEFVDGSKNVSAANVVVTGQIQGPAEFIIDPAAVGDNTGKVIIKGDFQVDGTTTTVNSTTVTIDDKNLVLADAATDSATADGAGITVNGAAATFNYVHSGTKWQANKSIETNSQLISTVATGTAPLSVTSTTLVSNLNADKLDGQEGSYYTDITARLGYTPVNKAGDTMTGDLTISSSGTAASPNLSLNNSATSSFVHSLEALSPNITSGQHNIIVFGKAGNTKNSGYIGYNWDSDASNTNYVTIGHWGSDDLFRVYADGVAKVGTNTIWHAGNDGSGSGLDADTLDGNEASAFALSGHTHSYLPLSGGTLSGGLVASGGISGLTLANGISGTNFNITGVNELEIADPGEGIRWKTGSSGDMLLAVVDDASDNILNFSGTGAAIAVNSNIVWHAGNDGAGSGLDADTLDGNQASAFALASHTHSYLSAESDTLATVTGRGATTSTAVTLNGNVSLGTSASLSFGSQTRQMINLWSSSYGIGVQSNTQYFRAGSRFSWFFGGSHTDNENNAGGGTVAMTVDSSSNLSVTGNVSAAALITSNWTIDQDASGDLTFSYA